MVLLVFEAAVPLFAVEDNGNYNNTTDPGSSIPNWTTGWGSSSVDGWNYVGQINGGASGTYLGGGWVITAAHVGAGNFQLGGVTYNLVSGSATSLTGGNYDLVLFRIASPPSLPALHIGQLPPVFFSAQTPGDSVAMLGYGGGHGETWGLDTVNGVNLPVSILGYSTTDFYAAYGTTTIGTASVTNNALLVTGDSGGGDFIYDATTGNWELVGVNEVSGWAAQCVQLSSYVQQILDITGLVAPPVISSQPQNIATYAGSSVSLSVGVSGSNPLSYQWFKNGATLSGATHATYTISTPAPGDSGSYAVTISNAYGSVSSTSASLAVTALALSGLSAQQIVTIGQSTVFCIDAAGNGPFTYQWTKNGAAIPSATGATYTVTNVTAASAANYAVVVANLYGSATSNTSQLVPVVSQKIILLGQSATFTATPTGSGPFTYQWQFNGATIPGATSQSYTITDAQINQLGIYSVTVTSASGNVVSNFSLTLEIAAESPVMPPGALAALAFLLLLAASYSRKPNPKKFGTVSSSPLQR